jgi:hypothetical protein
MNSKSQTGETSKYKRQGKKIINSKKDVNSTRRTVKGHEQQETEGRRQ